MSKIKTLAKEFTYAREAVAIYQKSCVSHSFKHQDMTLLKDLDSMKYWIEELQKKEEELFKLLVVKKLLDKPKEDKDVA
tara:strand:+ start:2083 stop:2319 length:237 start_codon:yes stop_codon:yes gene_type:complete